MCTQKSPQKRFIHLHLRTLLFCEREREIEELILRSAQQRDLITCFCLFLFRCVVLLVLLLLVIHSEENRRRKGFPIETFLSSSLQRCPRKMSSKEKG